MITPVAFSSIGYRTYIIFAVINGALILPVVYFFYPETAYRSLEEMDTIFIKTKSIFTVVKVAKEEPHRYDKNGNVLIDYADTEEHARRKSSATYTEIPRRFSRASGADEKGVDTAHV
jgi:hypothetical protein